MPTCGIQYGVDTVISMNVQFELMKGKALRMHSLHEKTAASFLLKLFISSNDATPLTPPSA